MPLKKHKRKGDFFDIFETYEQQRRLEIRRKAWLSEEAKPKVFDRFICLAL